MDPREQLVQEAFAKQLRRPTVSFDPQFYADDTFAMYGGDARADIPLGKNTSLGISAGGMAGRGYGKAKGAKMPFTPRGNVEFKYEF